MAVTVADEFAPNKQNRFVGICISRRGIGLSANFTLRNVIDNQGKYLASETYFSTFLFFYILKYSLNVPTS